MSGGGGGSGGGGASGGSGNGGASSDFCQSGGPSGNPGQGCGPSGGSNNAVFVVATTADGGVPPQPRHTRQRGMFPSHGTPLLGSVVQQNQGPRFGGNR